MFCFTRCIHGLDLNPVRCIKVMTWEPIKHSVGGSAWFLNVICREALFKFLSWCGIFCSSLIACETSPLSAETGLLTGPVWPTGSSPLALGKSFPTRDLTAAISFTVLLFLSSSQLHRVDLKGTDINLTGFTGMHWQAVSSRITSFTTHFWTAFPKVIFGEKR